MKKTSKYVFVIIAVIVITLATLSFLYINNKYKKSDISSGLTEINSKDSFFKDINTKSNIDLKRIMTVSLPSDLDSIQNIITDETKFVYQEKTVLNGVNTQGKFKLSNGLKEMISFRYSDNNYLYVDTQVWSKSEQADQWLDKNFDSNSEIIKQYEDGSGKCYVIYTKDNRVAKIAIKRENLIIYIKQMGDSNNNSSIDSLVKLLSDDLAKLK
ncbi:hypothetical protein JHL18_09800 [Clostridium sp. YIM B02505]|uniref:Uncharacterized protein n=1 Tax=Clostridium yunnanense TaxID=2800325 RepID=A0ABS1ENM9_9CLOT|nr:hypothetical protein [Clostridium yunnanense]MBK1810918.1 hypothetical protein [Clostridium yunnanense]